MIPLLLPANAATYEQLLKLMAHLEPPTHFTSFLKSRACIRPSSYTQNVPKLPNRHATSNKVGNTAIALLLSVKKKKPEIGRQFYDLRGLW